MVATAEGRETEEITGRAESPPGSGTPALDRTAQERAGIAETYGSNRLRLAGASRRRTRFLSERRRKPANDLDPAVDRHRRAA